MSISKANKKKFQTVAIIGRQHTGGVVATLAALCDFLVGRGVKIVSEPETALLLPERKLHTVSRAQLNQCCELIIVVGGDGSMLNVAPFAAKQNLPVLGINRGRLGFLTDINPDRIDKIAAILAGEYREEERFLLQVDIHSAGKEIMSELVLNDVVLSASNTTKLIEFMLCINGDCVCAYRADGLIVATPTGSTAYALSGGGPILHPNMNAIAIVPMFPHNLSSRPIVIDDNGVVELSVIAHNQLPLGISCDGKARVVVPVGASVKIRKATEKLRLIHPLDYNYFATLRSKLHWEQ